MAVTENGSSAPAAEHANGSASAENELKNGVEALNVNGDSNKEEQNGAGESDDDEDDAEGAPGDTANADKKKKKKKKKKGGAKKKNGPPKVGLSKVYIDGVFPVGQLEDYRDDNQWRSTSEEKRHLDRRMLEEEPSDSAFNYNAIRRAAEVHRRVRKYARSIIKPGMKMLDIANAIEDGTRTLVEAEGFKSGIGFPTGLNVNHCAAHWSPNPGDTTILHDGSMLKVDFGVHVNGRIVDSAFTLDFNTGYGKLMDAVQDATNTGVREAGIDVRVRDIGAAVQEVMESYEVEINGKTLPVKTIRNLTGHNITPYLIHGGKSVPITGSSYETDKMEEGEYFAIETFGTTGRGYVHDEGECSHYARAPDVQQPVRLPRARAVLNLIKNEFGTLPFCPRYIERLGEENFMPSLRHLAREGLLQDYPPLCDEPGSMTAQFEHTILLRPTCKEIVSRGDDY